MIKQITDTLKTRLDTLPYSDVVASLARTAVRRVESSTEEGVVYNIVEERFPVSAQVTGAECWQQGKYKQLAPNSAKKSIMYFEQIEHESLSLDSQKSINVTSKIRLVVWLNLKLLGMTDETGVCGLDMQLINLMQSKVSTTCGATPITAHIAASRIFSDPSIFEKYSYESEIVANMLLYPYTYFAIDFNVSYNINPSCFSFTPQTAIIC